jgi:hypothetical protein
MEVKQIIDEAIREYYSLQGREVPQWKMKKDPQWWIDYLAELDNENQN